MCLTLLCSSQYNLTVLIKRPTVRFKRQVYWLHFAGCGFLAPFCMVYICRLLPVTVAPQLILAGKMGQCSCRTRRDSPGARCFAPFRAVTRLLESAWILFTLTTDASLRSTL